MSIKKRVYSPEEYFIPKDNRPPVIHVPGREEDMVEIPGEQDVQVLETEGGEIVSSQEFFGLNNSKAKVTIANVIFSENINHDWEKEYYAEQYKLGKWNPPIPSKESIQDKFMVTLGIESIGDAVDTPLIIKGESKENDDKMTADDLTTDPDKVEELKEKFGEDSEQDSDVDTGDSDSTEETPTNETDAFTTEEDSKDNQGG